MKTFLLIPVLLTGCTTQLAPEHGRERIFTLGIGIVERITTTRESASTTYFNTPAAYPYPAEKTVYDK